MENIEDADVPNWTPYLGNNHERIVCHSQWGGGVSMRECLNKPLSDRLWKDLIGRLGVSGLRVYGPNDAQWTDSPRGACVYVDKDGKVSDIRLFR